MAVIRSFVFAAVCATAISSLTSAQAADAPKDKPPLPAALASYVSVTATLAKAGEDATAELRTFKRAEYVRLAVGRMLYEAKPGSHLTFDYYALPSIICDGREEFFVGRGPARMLTTINDSLTTLYTDTAADESTWTKLIKWLSKTVSGAKTALPDADLTKVSDVCKEDIQTFEARGFRTPVAVKSAVLGDLVGGIKDAFAVIEPVVKQALQIVTDYQRRKAVREFFRNDNNRKLVREGATQLRAAVKSNNERNRAIALSEAAAAWAKLATLDLDLKTVKPCEAFLALDPAKRDGEKPFLYGPQFIVCHAATMAAIRDNVDALLTKASAYDTAADIGAAAKSADVDADKKFDKMLGDLASSKLTLNEFLDGVGVYLNLAIEIEKATSKESQQKIRDAIDKALGKG